LTYFRRSAPCPLAQDHSAAERDIGAAFEIGQQGLRLRLHGDFEVLPQQLALQFIHPLDDSRDFALVLRGIGGGDYVASQAQPLPAASEAAGARRPL